MLVQGSLLRLRIVDHEGRIEVEDSRAEGARMLGWLGGRLSLEAGS